MPQIRLQGPHKTWDKFIFFKGTALVMTTEVQNTVIKKNVTITVDFEDLENFINKFIHPHEAMLVQKKLHEDGTLRFTHHADDLELSSDLYDCVATTPKPPGWKSPILGMAVDKRDPKNSNIEIKFIYELYPGPSAGPSINISRNAAKVVLLNIHLHNKEGITADTAYARTITEARTFSAEAESFVRALDPITPANIRIDGTTLVPGYKILPEYMRTFQNYLRQVNEASTRIQALWRGHTIRKLAAMPGTAAAAAPPNP